MLGITLFYVGHEASYINSLAKLIDLATKLDFEERVYDLCSFKKTNNLESVENTLNNGIKEDDYHIEKNKDDFQEESHEVEIVNTKVSQESYINEDVNNRNINQTLEIMKDEEKMSSNFESTVTTKEIQEEKKDVLPSRPSLSKKRYSKGGSFQCNVPLCDKSYMYERDLQNHVKFSHNGVGFLCTICNHLSRNKTDLKSHIDGVHGSPKYLCTICGSKFSQKTGLRTHTQAVHDKIKYNCNECTHISTTLSSLGWHMKQKHVNIEYSCKNCAFKSKTTYGLKRHQDGHCQNEKEYICQHCGNISKSHSAWLMHPKKKFCLSDKYKSQIERKKMICEICDKKFILRNNLLHHIKRMHQKQK